MLRLVKVLQCTLLHSTQLLSLLKVYLLNLSLKKEIAEAKAIESGKPANIVEKMVTGSVEKYLNEVALDRQMYVIDNDKKVADVLKATGTTVVQFARFEVGEGIEKKLNFLSLKKLLLLKLLQNN